MAPSRNGAAMVNHGATQSEGLVNVSLLIDAGQLNVGLPDSVPVTLNITARCRTRGSPPRTSFSPTAAAT